ncbi:MAG: ABC transporter ATP-binding protein [Candidatus Bathyarchaeia archaeon]
MPEQVLNVRNLKVNFYTYAGVVQALNGVSFDIYRGEVFGIVGETGCGKSVTANSILQLVDKPGRIVEGEIFFKGTNLLKKTENELRAIRGNQISIVFQDPMTYLNPVLKIGEQIIEVILKKQKRLNQNASKEDILDTCRAKAIDVLKEVRMPNAERVIDQYPHELSGGMRQRAMIAMAISCDPELLILDEATTFLDVTIQRQILGLVKNLKDQLGCTLLIITHDMGIIAEMCDRVGIMYAGTIVECSSTETIFKDPYHPYTRGLLAAIPSVKGGDKTLEYIPGSVPNLIYPPTGCRFHPRCEKVMDICSKKKPELIEFSPGHFVACHLYSEMY